MKLHYHWGRWLVAMGGLLVAVLVVRRLQDHEPRFEGRRLSAWLDDPKLSETQITHAVRAMGTNAIPQLESWLIQKPSMLEKLLRWTGRNFEYFSFSHQPSLDANFRAMRGFFALGKMAAPAVPWLEEGAAKKNEDFEFYLTALALCGPDGARVLDRLVPTFSARETETYVRALAFGIRQSPELVPRLEGFLAEPDPRIRRQTLWTIRDFRGRCPPGLLVAVQERAKIETDKDLRETAALISTELSKEIAAASIKTEPQAQPVNDEPDDSSKM